MAIDEFLPRAAGHVRIRLSDGSVHTGEFRTDILGPTAISAFFRGDARDISLPIEMIDAIEPLGTASAP
ncbi:hypothetical protein WPS_10920 [Vulcanimicrobium alpinum]|uniref:Uncharacterized protein n=1 Tax=Vulcanimicrobium alpinum TaxID=3016050 RepID=A0AAN2C9A5_UNVUL|nr:hypothetical protein [Vulcanimicrobium alpinum]BDE05816.1 hypothetical protein WPS_10920 [Vulcanimicrobium alpinum]